MWAPYFRHCVDCFGFDRCMFASNFPVDAASCGYTIMWNAFKLVCDKEEWGQKEQCKLFHDTAQKVYKL